MATNDQTFIVRDDHLLDPKIDPQTGKVPTFTGWRDLNYKPEAGATPYLVYWTDEFAGGGSASPSAPASVLRTPRSPRYRRAEQQLRPVQRDDAGGQ